MVGDHRENRNAGARDNKMPQIRRKGKGYREEKAEDRVPVDVFFQHVHAEEDEDLARVGRDHAIRMRLMELEEESY